MTYHGAPRTALTECTTPGDQWFAFRRTLTATQGVKMFNLRSARSRVLPAALAVLILGAAGAGIADAAPSGSHELTTKAAPVVPLSAQSAPRLAGSSAIVPASSQAESQMRTEASQDGACDVGDVCL